MIDTARLDTGMLLSRMGSFYARSIHEKMEMDVVPWETTMLFGLACKGVPLATAATVAMAAAFELDFGCSFNRKGSMCMEDIFVGRKPGKGDRVIIVDDIMTSGTALRETIDLFSEYAPEAEIVGAVIAVDRKEHGRDRRLSAAAEAQYELGIPIFSLIDIDEILLVLKSGEFERENRNRVKTALPTARQIVAVEDYLSKSRAS